MGAFLGDELLSFEVTCLVGNTLILKTIVNSDKALQLETPQLLLHHVRTRAVDCPDICIIYDGMLSQKTSLDKYKIMRGARVLALPAHHTVHSILLALVAKVNRRIYKRLLGRNEDALHRDGWRSA